MNLEANKLALIKWITEIHKEDIIQKLLVLKHEIEQKNIPRDPKKRGAFGSIKGEVWMAEDFNDPQRPFR